MLMKQLTGGTVGGGGIQYALSYSLFTSGGIGGYIGYIYDSDGNKLDNTEGTITNDYVSVTLSGNASSSSITVTCKKAGYYNVFGGTRINDTIASVSTREYKNVNDTIYTITISNGSGVRRVNLIIWLEA